MKFHGTQETLDKILSLVKNGQSGAYIRFGDGDVAIACGGVDSYQEPNPYLAQELKRLLGLEGEGILKTIPLNAPKYGGWEPGMGCGVHASSDEWCDDLLNRAEPFWPSIRHPDQEIYSQVALHHTATCRPQEAISFLKASFLSLALAHALQTLKRVGCHIFVGNGNVPEAFIRELLGPDCAFVRTPIRDGYSVIDETERKCIETLALRTDYGVVVTCSGISGRALIGRLLPKFKNVFFFDFGSLMDALMGWNTRAWIELTGFDGQAFMKMYRE